MGGGGDIYKPSKQDYAAQNANYGNIANQTSSILNTYVPQAINSVQGATSAYTNNPYAASAQNGVNNWSGFAQNVAAPLMVGGAGNLYGGASQLAGYIPQTLSAGYDPQNALYATQFQQMQDQQNAINAQNNVSGPYAAGLSGQAARMFNLDWLSNLQNRQSQAAGTANTLLSGAGTGYGGASQLAQGAYNAGVQGAQAPWQQYASNAGQNLQAQTTNIAAIGSALGLDQNQMNSLLQYLQYGTNASQAQAQANAASWAGIGKLFGGLGSIALAPVTGGGSLIGNFLG